MIQLEICLFKVLLNINYCRHSIGHKKRPRITAFHYLFLLDITPKCSIVYWTRFQLWCIYTFLFVSLMSDISSFTHLEY